MTRTALTGVAAATGGICWVVAACLAAVSPPHGSQGNIANRFVGEDAWSLAALPLLAVAAWGLSRDERVRMATSGRAGAVLFVVGASLASMSLAMEAAGVLVLERPMVEIGSRVLLVPLGGLLLAWSVFRARTVPVPAAALLLFGAALLYVANSENWMAALAAVFGVGWITVGVVLVLRGRHDRLSSGQPETTS